MTDLKIKHQDTSSRALQIYTLYRIAVSGFLLVLFLIKSGSVFLGQLHPDLFHWTVIVYFSTSIAFYFLNKTHLLGFRLLVELQVFIDIILITLLMHASGGIATGLGILMAVSVITVSLLIAKSSSIVFAAIATAAVLGEAIYLNLSGESNTEYITQAGLLGATFFATSLFALLTARRLQQSELEAEMTSADLASLEKLNEQIIQFMKTGVVVIDEEERVQLINTAAWELLEMPDHIHGQRLRYVSEELANAVKRWRLHSVAQAIIRPSSTGPRVQVTFASIEGSRQGVIFMEDTTSMTQQAQNMKLASLGRLTASIAHEIRNPLGALSHAAQLLDESPDLIKPDKKLVDMIQKNAIRVNTIIENILQLSQRKESAPQNVQLEPFLHSIAEELQKNHAETLNLFIEVQPSDLSVNFDISQLMQVVTNLAENGLRYSIAHSNEPYLSLIAQVNLKSKQVFLDIIDKGEGISPEVAQNIFEPFFTTSSTGTGLGLYVSKELCEANRAQLDYIPVPSGGSCFRITFERESR